MHRIVVENLGKYFDRRVIFRRLSFALEGGKALAVTGANGSGKSTLIRILAGVLTPSKGHVYLYNGSTLLRNETRPLLTGLVAPYLNVYDGLSARENLRFLVRARRMSHAAPYIDEVLDLVGLGDRVDERVATFSSGMKQRVKFATALMTGPPLLLLDEPSSNLDSAGLAMLERVIQAQKASGGLLVLATNDVSETRHCDETIRIEDYHPGNDE